MRRLVMLTLLLATAAAAEIEGRYYAQWQHDAPEALTVEVIAVDLDWCFFCDSRDAEIQARVKEVERTATGLQVGSLIVLEYIYREHDPERAGPSEIPLLRAREVYPAFVARASGASHYVPAAGGYSFERALPLPEPDPEP